MMLLDAGAKRWTRHCVIMAWFPHELTDVVVCGIQPKHVSQIGTKSGSTQCHGTNDISFESRVRSQRDAASEKMLDPIEGSPATGKSAAGIINLFVDDLFGKVEPKRKNVSSQTEKRFSSWFRRLE